ncbi:hypothetical protein ACOSQ3_002872 [Xanthoceras sorbifolium]
MKSGYRVAAQEKLSFKCSSSCPDSKWWLSLWNLNIPPKIKIFIWRVCHNAIPSLCNLCSRKIVVDPCCPRYGDAFESSAHALFWCICVAIVKVLKMSSDQCNNLANFLSKSFNLSSAQFADLFKSFTNLLV